jgi:tetratricopeptide (TPR) repeat protein
MTTDQSIEPTPAAVCQQRMHPRRTKFSRVALSLALTFAAVLVGPVASAAGPSDPVVAQLKRRGDAAIEAGKYQLALEEYTKALAVEPSPALHYNRGRALQGLGRNAEALAELEQFEQTAPQALRAAVPNLEDMIRLVRGQIAELRLSCSAPGAVLHVGASVLVLPLERPLRFDPGNVDIEVVATGYEPWRSRLSLGPGDRRELTPKLVLQDLRGTLVVTSSVTGAFVRVDGKPVGTAPVELRLAPGEHSISLGHADYEPATSRVVLRPKERRSYALSLQRSPRLYERWWFWTGVGAAVAAGVVVGVAVSSEKPASKGDIPPGRLTANLSTW